MVYDAAPGSQVGGANVRMSGSGDNAMFSYAAPMAQPGARANLTGTGDNAMVTYGAAPARLSELGTPRRGG